MSYVPLWENWKYTGKLLGEGGMSSVFEIKSDGTGEICALKVVTVKALSGDLLKVPSSSKNEIKILISLANCPNIVRYLDHTERKVLDDSGNIAAIDILIRMEKLKPLSEGTPLTDDQIVLLAKNMCNALVSAAKKGIIHRDIKPQNIFVDENGVYKLGDFGVAKIVSDVSYHYTKEIGTFAYAAPEVFNKTGAEVYDDASDIYSLGLVLYTFLNNGYLPFVDKGIPIREAVNRRLGGEAFPAPSRGDSRLKSIVMRACDFDPKRRFQSAKEMLNEIEFMESGNEKGLIKDPYATLDANDGGDFTPVSVAEEYTAPAETVKHTEKLISKGKLKINVGASGKKAVKSSDEHTIPEYVPTRESSYDSRPSRDHKRPGTIDAMFKAPDL